jgi:hypothetical protein
MYAPTTWVTGDVITQAKANNWETAFQEATDETRLATSIGGGALTMNLAVSRVFEVAAFNANINSFTVQNVPASGRRGYFEVWLKQDGTVRTITWPAAFKWDGGVAPTFPGTNTKYVGMVFETWDNGANWYGGVLGLAY